jgi:organic hydroperoxide reductase OsmC/OhrA
LRALPGLAAIVHCPAAEASMHHPFPHEYEVTLEWPGQGAATVNAGPRPPLTVGAPPEFGGQEAWWSPEHLLLSSLSACFTATFDAIARMQHLQVESYRCRAHAVLAKTGSGLAFTELSLAVSAATAPEDVLRVTQALFKAKERCIVAGALRLPVTLEMAVDPVSELVPA